MDVRCPFLSRKLEEALHIYQPSGYLDHPEKNAKKSPWWCHKVLKSTLICIGLTPCLTDPCLYYSQDKEQPLWLFAHVDDLISGGTWNQSLRFKIKTFFETEDLRIVKYALQIGITQKKENISLIQDEFIQKILTELNANQIRPQLAPLPFN
ncbi:hypothetical protein O181_092766 [Austropuccinia psidii MF-1]|uniref:Reverse transcriptase Ty1/copia-type domain-containing protein n=1 Tax=Austropuccinia psidii MF-1 TaxID=1389203 RepID=A0A9Q3J062_9BASI|nr:hypothetical protein [Austropuccinia psidii MF-1]